MDVHASFNAEDELVQVTEPNVTFIIDESTLGKGLLYVAESKLFWKNDLNDQVVSVEYESMCIFGTCNHETVHEKPCILIIVDFTYKPSESTPAENGSRQNGINHEDNIADEENNDLDENEDNDEEDMKSKIKLVPDNPDCLAEIYGAFTRNQSRHSHNTSSTEDDSENADEDEGEFDGEDLFQDFNYEYRGNDEDEEGRHNMLMN